MAVDDLSPLCYNVTANEQNGAFCCLALPSTEYNVCCKQNASIVYATDRVPLFVGTTASTMEAFCHMLTISVGEFIDEDFCLDGPESYCIYVIRDGAIVFYVGKSVNIITRLWQHVAGELGYMLYSMRASELGRFIAANMPDSRKWQIDLLTLDDCRHYTVFNVSAGRMDTAEIELITLLRPCLNRIFNRQYREGRLTGYKQPWIRKITDEMLSFL